MLSKVILQSNIDKVAKIFDLAENIVRVAAFLRDTRKECAYHSTERFPRFLEMDARRKGYYTLRPLF